MNKIIWMYWEQGGIPEGYNGDCIKEWIKINPTWNVKLLDYEKVLEYIPELDKLPKIRTVQSRSDYLRVSLLEKYGGVWADASVWPLLPLDNWLDEELNKTDGLFMYKFDPISENRITSSWFIAVSKSNNYLIKKWREEFEKKIMTNNKYPYYIVHHTLTELMQTDEKIKKSLDLLTITEKGPHSGDLNSYMWKRQPKKVKLLKQLRKDYKHIFIIWFQGFENMPEICKACYYSWKNKNPDWNIIFIDESNINNFINDNNLSKIRKFNTLTTQSELVRYYLIGQYGGVYVDATNYCQNPLNEWIPKLSLVDNTWMPWDFDSHLPTVNFFYSNGKNKTFMDIYNKILNDSSLYKGEYLRTIIRFKQLMPEKLLKLKNNQIGKSSNNTNPKQGVKIIANSVELMNQKNDETFEESLNIYPFFKLTYKGVPKGKLTDIFNKDSKVIKLLYHE